MQRRLAIVFLVLLLIALCFIGIGLATYFYLQRGESANDVNFKNYY